MTREDIDNIISIICPNDEDFEKPIISPAYLKKELEVLALEQNPSGDLISRQAVIDLMRSLTRWCVRSEDGKINNVGLLYDDVMFGIDKLPSVNPQEPKTGHWIWCVGSHKCSNCEEYTCFSHKELLRYCPNCGAKMVEPQERSEKE